MEPEHYIQADRQKAIFNGWIYHSLNHRACPTNGSDCGFLRFAGITI